MIELMKQSYLDIMMMPIDRFYKMLKMKDKFDKEVNRVQKEELDKI